MELDITIEVAAESQLDEILPQFRAYQAYYSQLTGAGEEQTRTFLHELLRNPDRGFILLARSRSLVVGFATGFVTVSGVLASRLVHLGDLYIAPEYRGRTIGARLVDECTRFARAHGYRRIRLWTNTVLGAARHLYEAAGYRRIASEPHQSFGHRLVGETWELAL